MIPTGLLKWLPLSPGLLPKWLFFLSVVSVFNSAQTYLSGLELTKRVYSTDGGQVTKLSARTFGTWTMLASVVRLYAAYHPFNQPVYDLCIFTFILAGFHFASEWFCYKTTKWGKGLAGPVIVSTLSTLWMLKQREFYTAL